MDNVIAELIRSWGTFGLIIVFFGFMIWDKVKSAKEQKGESEGKYKKDDMIYESLKDIKTSLTENIETINIVLEKNVEAIDEKINTLESNVDKKFSYLETTFNDKIVNLEQQIREIPVNQIQNVIKAQQEIERSLKDADEKAFDDVLRLGDDIFDTLSKYTEEINCNHIFIGSFHNGSNSLMGIPYIKFNIIREVFHPTDNYEIDHAFAPVYKDCDLSLLGKLPNMLVQNKQLYFVIDENNESEMSKYDGIIIRRMIGFGIKQIALHVTQENGKPSGFVGCVRYDYKEMDLDALELCVKELELIHNNTPSSPEKIKKIKKTKKNK